MVTRNFTLQDLPYTRLLQVPDEDREFLTLEELKPHQLTELSGVVPVPSGDSGLTSRSNTNTLHNSRLSPSAGTSHGSHQLTSPIINNSGEQVLDEEEEEKS